MKLKTDFNRIAKATGWSSFLTLCLALGSACGDNDTPEVEPDAAPEPPMPDAGVDAMPPAEVAYEFESRFASGQSSVEYSGQVLRQVLIAELTSYIGKLTDEVETKPPADGAVATALEFYLAFDSSTGGDVMLSISTTPPLLQKTFNDVSMDRQLLDKLAGNDASTDHEPWNTPGSFVGWSEGGEDADTPTELVRYWFGLLDDLAFQRGQGTVPEGPDGEPIDKVYVTAAGQDLQQLIQKFLTVGVTFSQGADDYLDDDIDGKGILSPNTRNGEAPYTTLEHAWDEGFGYFGAARDYDLYSDEELSGAGGRDGYQSYHDSTGDGSIDLTREYNFAISVNCAKRDLDSAEPTNFTKDAFDAFVAGRAIIAEAGETLTEDQRTALTMQSDIAVSAWEKCIAATVAHYINETLADMNAFGTEEYSFEDHAKHWSELKGFSLGLQFNPESPMLEGTRFADFHARIGDAPVLPNDEGGQDAIDAYKAALLEARDIVQEAYDFSQANVEAW